jgi:DNA-binding IclR family transcriptional regulator
VSVGVPVLGQAGFAVAAIGTFMPAPDLEGESGRSLVAQMRSTAARISHYLGFEAEVATAVS